MEGQLFSDIDFRSYTKGLEEFVVSQIDGLGTNEILKRNPKELVEFFENTYRLETPQLQLDQVAVDYRETDVDVSRDPARIITDRTRPFFLKGTLIEFIVPFDGNMKLFEIQPTSFTQIKPRGEIKPNELRLKFSTLEHDHDDVRKSFNRNIGEIQSYLRWIATDVNSFNVELKQAIHQRIEWRREKLIKDQGMVAALGFPLKRRDNPPQTYVAPVTRRKLPVQKESAMSALQKSEPYLDMSEYENIIKIISNMAKVMELSPNAFKGMKEEDLRSHFLVQLNAQYEGSATGETFNYGGKTDIIIRAENKNIFIAECKFWEGEAGLVDAIDQLLRYSSWRDTKTALILFNKNKNLSSVLSRIPKAVKQHPNFLRHMDYKSETGFRFGLHQKNDKEREIIVTTLVFDVP